MEQDEKLSKQVLSKHLRPMSSNLQQLRGRSTSRDRSLNFQNSLRSQTFDYPRGRLDRYSQAPEAQNNFTSQAPRPDHSQIPLEMSRRISKLQDAYNNNKESVDFYLRESVRESQPMLGSKHIVPAQVSINDLKRSLALDPMVRRKISIMQRNIRDSDIVNKRLEPLYPEYVIYKTRDIDLNNRIDPEVGQIALRKQRYGTEQPDYYKIIFYNTDPIVEGTRKRFKPRTMPKRDLADPLLYIDKKVNEVIAMKIPLPSELPKLKPLLEAANMDPSQVDDKNKLNAEVDSILAELENLGTQSLLSDEEKEAEGDNILSNINKTSFHKSKISTIEKREPSPSRFKTNPAETNYKEQNDGRKNDVTDTIPKSTNAKLNTLKSDTDQDKPSHVNNNAQEPINRRQNSSKDKLRHTNNLQGLDEQHPNLLSAIEPKKNNTESQTDSNLKDDDNSSSEAQEEQYDHVKLDFLDDLLYKNVPAIPEVDEDAKTYMSSHFPSDCKKRIRKNLNSKLRKVNDYYKAKNEGSEKDGSSYRLSSDFSKDTRRKSSTSRKTKYHEYNTPNSQSRSRYSSKRRSQTSDGDTIGEHSKDNLSKNDNYDLQVSDFNKKANPIDTTNPNLDEFNTLEENPSEPLAALMVINPTPVFIFASMIENTIKLPKSFPHLYEFVEYIYEDIPRSVVNNLSASGTISDDGELTYPDAFGLSKIVEESIDDYNESLYTGKNTLVSNSNISNDMEFDDDSLLDSDMGMSYGASQLHNTQYNTNISVSKLGIKLPLAEIHTHYDDGTGFSINLATVNNVELITIKFAPISLDQKLNDPNPEKGDSMNGDYNINIDAVNINEMAYTKQYGAYLNQPLEIFEIAIHGYIDIRKPLCVKFNIDMAPIESYTCSFIKLHNPLIDIPNIDAEDKIPTDPNQVIQPALENNIGQSVKKEDDTPININDKSIDKSFGSNSTVKKLKPQQGASAINIDKSIQQMIESSQIPKQGRIDDDKIGNLPKKTPSNLRKDYSLVIKPIAVEDDRVPPTNINNLNISDDNENDYMNIPDEKFASPIRKRPEIVIPSSKKQGESKLPPETPIINEYLLSPDKYQNNSGKRKSISPLLFGPDKYQSQNDKQTNKPDNRMLDEDSLEDSQNIPLHLNKDKLNKLPFPQLNPRERPYSESRGGINSNLGFNEGLSPIIIARKTQRYSDVPDEVIQQPSTSGKIRKYDGKEIPRVSIDNDITPHSSEESSLAVSAESISAVRLSEAVLNNQLRRNQQNKKLITSTSCCVTFFLLSSCLWIVLFKELSDKTDKLNSMLFKTPTLDNYYDRYTKVYSEFEDSHNSLVKGQELVKDGTKGYRQYTNNIMKFLTLKRNVNVNLLNLKTHLAFYQKSGPKRRILDDIGDDDIDYHDSSHLSEFANVDKIDVKKISDDIKTGLSEMKRLLTEINDSHDKYTDVHGLMLENVDRLYRKAFSIIDEFGKFYMSTNHIWVATNNIARHTKSEIQKYVTEIRKKHFKYHTSMNSNVQLSLLKHLSGARVESVKRIEIISENRAVLACKIAVKLAETDLDEVKKIFNMGVVVNQEVDLDEKRNFMYEAIKGKQDFGFFKLSELSKGRNYVDMYAVLYTSDMLFDKLDVICIEFIDYPKIQDFIDDKF